MTHLVLLERPESLLRDGPVRLLARNHGKYRRPVTAYAIDFRLEDNPACDPQAQGIRATWVAKHPIDDLYVVWRQGQLLRSNAGPDEVRKLIGTGCLPQQPYSLPSEPGVAWWEYVVALGRDYQIIKAAKCPRTTSAGPAEPTPEEVDEAIVVQDRLQDRIARVYSVT